MRLYRAKERGKMTTFKELKQKTIELDIEIRQHIQQCKNKNAQWAAEQAVDILSHQVVEWLETAAKRE